LDLALKVHFYAGAVCSFPFLGKAELLALFHRVFSPSFSFWNFIFFFLIGASGRDWLVQCEEQTDDLVRNKTFSRIDPFSLLFMDRFVPHRISRGQIGSLAGF